MTTAQAFVYFQIIAKAGSIPWNDLELPEGRTLNAVQKMIGKEKEKAKRARAAGLDSDDEADGGKKKAAGGKVSSPSISFPLASR